jgi:hypothetical protein
VYKQFRIISGTQSSMSKKNQDLLQNQMIRDIKIFDTYVFTPEKEVQFKDLVTSLLVYTHIMSGTSVELRLLTNYLKGDVLPCISLLKSIVTTYPYTTHLVDAINELLVICV